MPEKRRKTEKSQDVAVARLDVAYDNLSRQAFAVWLRMAVEPQKSLASDGIAALAKRFRYQRRSFAKVLQQLRNAGFIRYTTPAEVGERASIQIVKKPVLVGTNQFVKL